MNHLNATILTSAYFGPVSYFCRFLPGNPVIIEQFDNYNKQSYRNRCRIQAANGVLDLSIPVRKNHGRKTKMKDVLIDYDTNWQKMHERGIISAYRSSPFFEFYYDDFEWVFRNKHKYLIDLNYRILEINLRQLEFQNTIKLSDSYEAKIETPDLRNIIHPKSPAGPDPDFKAEPYTQVFSSKFGFSPDLSIIDLLFNTGPEARIILKLSYQPGDIGQESGE